MSSNQSAVTAGEQAHLQALAAARRAIRAGDIVLAERWMRLAERHYACVEHAHLETVRRRRRTRAWEAASKIREER